jgi:Flp pilus assembly protein TadD
MAGAVQKKSLQKSKQASGRSVPSRENRDRQTPNFWWLAGIVILTVIVFSSSITRNFVNLDDPAYIRDNPFIKPLSWQNIKSIFSTFYNANYHPLTTLVYGVEYSLFKLNGTLYHFIDLLIHLANVCLVFVLISRLSPGPSPKERGERAWQVALITALLFAIHPMHVESVAWISELKDVLYSFFYITGLIFYIKYIKEKKPKLLAATFFLFLLSLLSKSAAVTFPLLLVLFDCYFLNLRTTNESELRNANTSPFGNSKKFLVRRLMEKIPFFLLSVVFGIVAIYSQKSAGAINADYMVHYTPLQRIFVVSYALVFYPVKLFLPFNLVALYYSPKVLPYYYYICPVIIAAVVFTIFKAKNLKRELIFGFAFYVLSILLVIQIIPVGYSVVSERYSYIPYIGLFFIAGNYLIMKWRTSKYVLACAVLFFSFLSYQRGKAWRDSVTLFSDIVEKNPTSAYAPFGLGKVQSENGDSKGALASFKRSIELDPTVPEVYFYRGNIYYNLQNQEAAMKDYQKAVALKPDYKEAYYNIGTVYAVAGKNEEAVENFSKAISIEPNQFMYARRGTAYFNLKKYAEAESDYTNALKRDSTASETWYNRGATYYNLAKNKEACDDWKKAFELGYEKAGVYVKAYCR